MALLKPAQIQQAFLKAGLLGFPGSGKTFTASMLAISISKRLASRKPVAFFDTESGSDYLIPKFKEAGVELLVFKSRAFMDLLEVGREAEKVACALIVDSISHVWQELITAYMRKKKIDYMQIQDWGELKRMWAVWPEFFVNSSLHILCLGRAGDVMEETVNAKGKQVLLKVGTKMAVEKDFGFEPSLLIEMERVRKGSKPGAGWIHRAHVLKDRTDMINGKAFDFTGDNKGKEATFKAFEPVLSCLNIGGEHVGVQPRTSDDMIADDKFEPNQHAIRAKQVTIALEEIQGTLVAIWPGQTAAEKAAKQTVLEEIFETRSWTAVESKPLVQLQSAVKILQRLEAGLRDNAPESIEGLKKLVDHCVEATFAEITPKHSTIDDDPLPE